MQVQEEMSATRANQALFVQMAVTLWDGMNKRVDKLIDELTDEQLAAETAPGRNTGTYLLGHLAAVNDGLLTLMGWGERLHPELDEMFLRTPDKSGQNFPPAATLKEYWKSINAELGKHINAMKPEEWFDRHMSVSPEDFAKEPHRNRLNVLMSRTAHQNGHLGQMIYLSPRKEA